MSETKSEPEPYLCDRPVNDGASGHCIRPDGHRGKCKGDSQ